MKVTPLKNYRDPTFPTRQVLDEHPELLRLLPCRWRNKPAVISTLAAASLLIGAGTLISTGAANAQYAGVPVMPLYLSEAEARQVIVTEAKRVGIKFTDTTRTLKGIPLLVPGNTVKKLNLQLDGLDTKRNIGYEFISSEDLDSWQLSGKTGNNTNKVARQLQQQLAKSQPKGTYTTFYDPLASGESPAYGDSAKESAKELLRMQVRDFIKWLKSQGVI